MQHAALAPHEIRVAAPLEQVVTVDPDRHARKCAVCRHPQREVIEDDFVHWRNLGDIAEEFRIRNISSLIRHARVFGFYARRRRNLRFVLENLLQRVDEVQPTAQGIVSAVRAYTRLTDSGEWVDPPMQHIVTARSELMSRPAEGTVRGEISNRPSKKLEKDLTR